MFWRLPTRRGAASASLLLPFFLLRYIQAATSPKDIVILVDVSGSMKGLRMAIAKHTITTILDTLGENDFVNILAVTAASCSADALCCHLLWGNILFLYHCCAQIAKPPQRPPGTTIPMQAQEGPHSSWSQGHTTFLRGQEGERPRL